MLVFSFPDRMSCEKPLGHSYGISHRCQSFTQPKCLPVFADCPGGVWKRGEVRRRPLSQSGDQRENVGLFWHVKIKVKIKIGILVEV